MLQNHSASAIFERYTIGRAYDEMFEAAGRARPHYTGIHERLCALPVVDADAVPTTASTVSGSHPRTSTELTCWAAEIRGRKLRSE